MTIEVLSPTPTYTVTVTGPYTITHPYKRPADLLVEVEQDGEIFVLTDADFSVEPEAADVSGALTLTVDALNKYAGGRLMVTRDTRQEQGWAGQTSREKGLEAQLDALTMGSQELKRQMLRTVRTKADAAGFFIDAGAEGTVPIFDAAGNLIEGPGAGLISGAEEFADRALSAASRAEAAVEYLEDTVPSIKPVTPDDIIVSDGTLTQLTIMGRYTSHNQIFLEIGGVHQPPRDQFYTLAPGATTTLITFPAVEKGLEVLYTASRQIAVPVADPAEIDFPDGSNVNDLKKDVATFDLFKNPEGASAAETRLALRTALDIDKIKLTDSLTTTGSIVVADSIEIDGGGKTLARDSATQVAIGTSTWPLFAAAGAVKLKDLKLTAPPVTGGRVVLTTNSAETTDVDIDGIELDLGNYNDALGNPVGLGNAIARFNNDGVDTNSFRARCSTFRRGSWGMNKNNLVVSTERNISYVDCSFEEFISVALLFNSPSAGSLMENILVANCDIGDNFSRQPFRGGGTTYAHRGTFAGHIHYGKVLNNHFYGQGSEMWRAEEDAMGIVIANNTAKLNGKDGLEIIPNNATDEGVYSPLMFMIHSNVIHNIGLDTDVIAGEYAPGLTETAPALSYGIGLQVYTTANAELADAETLSESAIWGNVIKGWAMGLFLHQGGGHRNLIHGNVIIGTTAGSIGIAAKDPSLGTHDNMITDCDVAVEFQRGGLMGRQHFRDTTDAFDPVVISTDSANPSVVTGWTRETTRREFVSGETELEVIDVGTFIDANITLSLSFDDATHYDMIHGRLQWSGTTFSFTPTGRKSTGSVRFRATNFIGIKNGNLAVVVNNTSGATVSNLRLQIGLTGHHQWGA